MKPIPNQLRIRVRFILPDKITLYKTIAISLSLLCLSLFGGILNLTATSSNGGRMPVYQVYVPYDYKDTHFTFNNFNEIKKPLLADIINIKGNVSSIGDFIMIGSFIAMVFIWIKSYRNKGGNTIYLHGTP